MRKPENEHWKRKTQALIAQAMSCLAHGQIDAKSFSNKLQQIIKDIFSACSVHSDQIHVSETTIRLDKLSKTKRLRQKFIDHLELLKVNEMGIKQISNSPTLTIGNIVDAWAKLTGQDKTEFESKVLSKITGLLITQYKNTKQLGFTDAQTYGNPEAAFNFTVDLFNILIEETPSEKMIVLVQKIQTVLITAITQPIDIDSELLHDASALVTNELVLQLSTAMSRDTTIKDRLLQPAIGSLIDMEVKKYGWENEMPDDNIMKLQSELREKGISPNKRTLSQALKKLNRRNIYRNIQNALADKLSVDLLKEVKQQELRENQIESYWVYEPISSGDQKETEKRVRELLFRRHDHDTR